MLHQFTSLQFPELPNPKDLKLLQTKLLPPVLELSDHQDIVHLMAILMLLMMINGDLISLLLTPPSHDF